MTTELYTRIFTRFGSLHIGVARCAIPTTADDAISLLSIPTSNIYQSEAFCLYTIQSIFYNILYNKKSKAFKYRFKFLARIDHIKVALYYKNKLAIKFLCSVSKCNHKGHNTK